MYARNKGSKKGCSGVVSFGNDEGTWYFHGLSYSFGRNDGSNAEIVRAASLVHVYFQLSFSV